MNVQSLVSLGRGGGGGSGGMLSWENLSFKYSQIPEGGCKLTNSV